MAHFRSDGNFLYAMDEYMEFYVPLAFFDETSKLATDFSSYIEAFGVFYIGIFQGGKIKEYKILKHPYQIKIYSYGFETRLVSLPDGDVACRVLPFLKNEKVMDAAIVQDGQNALTYLDMVLGGKIPNSIEYEKTAELWEKNQRMNKVNFGVRSEVEELVLALSYRYKGDISKTFAEVWGKDPSVGSLDYVCINTREICQQASNFSGITFEDIDSMITTGLNRTRSKGKEKYSPVEAVIKM